MSTKIVVIDEPCGFGKSTGLINDLKSATSTHPERCWLVVLPELGEVERFHKELGDKWYQPSIEEGSRKIDSIIKLMEEGKNILTTHSLYTRIRKFEYLLPKYDVIIDEVPTVAEKVDVSFGHGVFFNLIIKQDYIKVDPVTQLISVSAGWKEDSGNYETGTDIHIRQFMDKVIWSNVYNVNSMFCVMPLPDAFFTKPNSLTINTFLFEGTQLDYYMRLRGYKCIVKKDYDALKKFKTIMRDRLGMYTKNIKDRTGYTIMSGKSSQRRTQVAYFVTNTVKHLRKLGQEVLAENVLIASYKDAWFGKEENKNSKVDNKSRLKSTTKLGKADYTAMVTRGTNKFREKSILFLLGKLSMHPHLATFLNMKDKKAQEKFELSELVQLVYRTRIRDGKDIFLVSPDKGNIKLLDDFMEA